MVRNRALSFCAILLVAVVFTARFAEAQDADGSKGEERRKTAVGPGYLTARLVVQESHIGDPGQECPRDHVDDVVVLAVESRECDE